MKTIFILLDSLNRHFLPMYGNPWVHTPNLDRLAAMGTVFDQHYCGSLPCMPARRDMLTGRLNFLEAPWGPIEPWDDCLPNLLHQQRQTYSHLITDHYHYFHSGGEGYHTLFDSWEFERGQEGDAWRPVIHPQTPSDHMGKGKVRHAYWANRSYMNPELDEDYSTPRCFLRAVDFLEHNHDQDNWHLHLEAFDPHEPFDCPQRYVDQYNDTWNRNFYTWPQYGRINPDYDDAESIAHIQKQYAGTLTMADAWLGKLLDTMDRLDMWKDTTLILTTDHGHLLGEHGYWAKNQMMDYNELAHIPLVIVTPSKAGGKRVSQGLTTTIDLMPTILELHRAQAKSHVRGKSLISLLEHDAPHHEAVLFGYFGKDINLTNGHYSYCRQPLEGSVVYHHTAMPRGFWDFLPHEVLAKAESGIFLQTTYGIPHWRMAQPSYRHLDSPEFNPIYNLLTDPRQSQPIHDKELEEQLSRQMAKLMAYHDSPESQYQRVGLKEF